jgi:general secretion pathway protein A
MYEQFFGLDDRPFELTPNTRFLYLPPQHQEALSALTYALRYGKPLTVLTGEAGLGKTLLLSAAIERLEVRPSRLIVVKNPLLTRAEFLETVARAFGIPSAASVSKSTLLDMLEGVLARDPRARALLVADEAHAMPTELLEEIRLLSNIETATEKLLSVLLVGQPELAARLNEPSLRQLKQRVAVRCALAPLTADETASYVTSRLRTAGARNDALFSQSALARVHVMSRGIPRIINVICDNALVMAFAASQPQVDVAIVDEVAHDFDLREAAEPARIEEAGTALPRVSEDGVERSRAGQGPLSAAGSGPSPVEPPAAYPAEGDPSSVEPSAANPSAGSRRVPDARPMFESRRPVRGSFFSRVFSR